MEHRGKTIGDLSVRFAHHVLKSGHLGSLESMRRKYLPVALGSVNNGFVVPLCYFFSSAPWKQYTDFLQFTDVTGLQQWILLFAQWRQKGIQLTKLSLGEFSQLVQNSAHNMLSCSIPYPEIRHGVFSTPYIINRQLTIWEFANMAFQKASGTDICLGIVETVLFGFPITRPVTLGLMIQPYLESYVRSRLIHGDLDTWASGRAQYHNEHVSYFLPSNSSDEGTSISRLVQDMEGATEMDRVKVAFHRISQLLPTTKFLGSNSTFWQAVQEADLMTGYPHEYQCYLSTPQSSPHKMGYNVWDQVIRKGATIPYNQEVARRHNGIQHPKSWKVLMKGHERVMHMYDLHDAFVQAISTVKQRNAKPASFHNHVKELSRHSPANDPTALARVVRTAAYIA